MAPARHRTDLAAPTNEYYRPEIHIEDGVAEVPIAVHGSAYLEALDDATFFAASSLVGYK